MKNLVKKGLTALLALALMGGSLLGSNSVSAAPTKTPTAAEKYCQDNMVDADAIYLIFDKKGRGESVFKSEQVKHAANYKKMGFNLKVAKGDWRYFTAIPEVLTKTPYNYKAVIEGDSVTMGKFVKDFFTTTGEKFHWDFVFIYEDGKFLEPIVCGPQWPGELRVPFCEPDGVFSRTGGDPFGKNFIINGFSAGIDKNGNKANDNGIHGFGHETENAAGWVEYRNNGKNDPLATKTMNTFYAKYGDTEYIPEAYLLANGIKSQAKYKYTNLWYSKGTTFYYYHNLGAEWEDTHNIWLIQEMNREFGLLAYWERFFNHDSRTPLASKPINQTTTSTASTSTVVPATKISARLKADKGVSSYQFTVAKAPANGQKTLAYNIKYAGKTVKVYRWDYTNEVLYSSGSLKIASNGKITLNNLKSNNSYLLILI